MTEFIYHVNGWKPHIMMSLSNKIKFLFGNESFRLFVLTTLVIYAYYPFISGTNLGAGPGDAQIYQYQLHDALIQFKRGFFPVYVGQSEFSYFGISFIRAPYYILFGQLINILTFNQLNALYIQHLTVLLSAFIAAFLSYFLLIRLAPSLRWFAVAIAFLYISCPGVIGLIYRCDAYFSFMAIPYFPLVMYGLARVNQNNDRLAHIITGVGLSLIWMAHPPLGLWTSIVTLFFYLIQFIFLRKGLLNLFIMGCLFLLLNLWQFTCIYSMGLNYYSNNPSLYHYNNAFALHLKKLIAFFIKADLPGAFLPLGWQISGTPFLQLGYSLWFILLGGIAVAIWRFNDFLIRCFLACCLLLFLFLYPIPLLNQYLWALIPPNVLEFTMWPMQRFYVIVSSLTCFIGILTLKQLFPSAKKSIKQLISLTFVLFCFWNLYQINYFLQFSKTSKSKSTSWSIPENIYLYPYFFTPIHGEHNIGVGSTFVPQLKNKLLDKHQIPLAEYDNEHLVIHKCLGNIAGATIVKTISPNIGLPIQINNSTLQPIFNISPLPTDNPHFIFCSEAQLGKAGIISLETVGAEYASYSLSIGDSKKSTKKLIGLPIYYPKNQLEINQPKKNGVTIYGSGKAKILSYGLINYDLNSLPIQIQSFTPYQATVETTLNNLYLDVYKVYFPGYKATVNGKNVPVIQSDNKTVIIPLKNKGYNRIELSYVGTPLMRISLYISAISWLITLVYLIANFNRK